MKKMTHAEALDALRDPWAFCTAEIHRRNLGSRELGEAIDAPRSTLRQVYSGQAAYPNYPLLMKIVNYLLDTRNAKASVDNDWNPSSMPVERRA